MRRGTEPSLSVLRPRQGRGLTGHLPSGHRTSAGPGHRSQDLMPAAGLHWVMRAGPGARVPSKPALRHPEVQPGPGFSSE